jgi:hypothetical protein
MSPFTMNDFVLLNDDIECWIVRIEDISLLEACCNCTLVHFFDDRLLIRRILGDCERRLDSSIFFFPCFSRKKDAFIFEETWLFHLAEVEFVLSRRQSVLFHKTRGL